jgi:hypothetical protein
MRREGKVLTYTKNRLLANQLNLAIGDRALCIALAISFDIAEITNMTVGISGTTVALAEGVDYIPSVNILIGSPSRLRRNAKLRPVVRGGLRAWLGKGMGGSRRTVRASRSATVGVVTELMDVHASLGVGVMAGDVEGDGGGRGLG